MAVTTDRDDKQVGPVAALYVPMAVDAYGQGPASVADFHHYEHQIWDAETNGTLCTAKDEAVARWIVGLINDAAPRPSALSEGVRERVADAVLDACRQYADMTRAYVGKRRDTHTGYILSEATDAILSTITGDDHG